jgi:TolA-binding protein
LTRPTSGCDEEPAAYMEHLRVCEDCWGAWLISRSLDTDGAAQPGDEQIAARAADRTLRALRREAPRPRRTARAAAAAVLLAGTVASAGVYQYRRVTVRKGEAPAAHSNGVAPRSARPAPQASIQRPAVAPAPEPTSATVSSPAVAHRAATSHARFLAERPSIDPAPPVAAVTAAGLFAEAANLRQSGQSAEAIATFQRLQREFPGTPEATVSLISLAEMLADASRPDAALALFDAYLATAPSGPLYPEALHGKARALEKLGRMPEAQSVRRELGQRMPSSPYARER